MNQKELQNENVDTQNYLLGYLSSLKATCSLLRLRDTDTNMLLSANSEPQIFLLPYKI